MEKLYTSAEAGRLPNTMYKDCSHQECKHSHCKKFTFVKKENGTCLFRKVG